MQSLATLDLTPTQRKAEERRRSFYAAIASKSADLSDRKTRQQLAAIPIAAVEAPLVSDPVVELVQPDADLPPASPNWFVVLASDPKERPRHSIRKIQTEVCKHYDVKLADMLSARRTANVVRPRQVAYYLCKEMTPHSLPLIGRRFGGRDHTTALSGIKKIARLRLVDQELNATLNLLASQLEAEFA